ncbi:hypothetical protein BdWA1_003455 [Babesia duncani]|uniref:Uncharacterized protein n=1 Tax=Babesia duncani TaxID=323732 RepID=A0AAD9PI27_9APIC|nr:hypothetical protein BdWA1_003455 [Babesia duncani]
MVACYVYVAIYWLSILYPVHSILDERRLEPVGIDITDHDSSDHISVAAIIFNEYATGHVFTPIDTGGFNIITDGYQIIWESGREETKRINHYEAYGIHFLSFNSESKNDEAIKNIYYKKEPGKQWEPTDYKGCERIRFMYFNVTSLDIGKSTTNDFFRVTDKSTADFVNKLIEVNSRTLIVEAFFTVSFPLYTFVNLLEQCKVILLLGPPNKLECKIVIAQPGGHHESEHIQMNNGEWMPISRSLRGKDENTLGTQPMPMGSVGTLDKEDDLTSQKKTSDPFPNSKLRSDKDTELADQIEISFEGKVKSHATNSKPEEKSSTSTVENIKSDFNIKSYLILYYCVLITICFGSKARFYSTKFQYNKFILLHNIGYKVDPSIDTNVTGHSEILVKITKNIFFIGDMDFNIHFDVVIAFTPIGISE